MELIKIVSTSAITKLVVNFGKGIHLITYETSSACQWETAKTKYCIHIAYLPRALLRNINEDKFTKSNFEPRPYYWYSVLTTLFITVFTVIITLFLCLFTLLNTY